MLMDVPKELEERFDRAARRIFGDANTTKAWIAALENWLDEHHVQSFAVNPISPTIDDPDEKAFDELLPELLKLPPEKWFVIARGQLQGTADSFEAANQLASDADSRIIMQVHEIELKTQVIELGWQMSFKRSKITSDF